MKTLLSFSIVSFMTALALLGCSHKALDQYAIEDRNESGLATPLYFSFLSDAGSYSSVSVHEGDRLRDWQGAYTLANAEIDALIAGERQGDEQSFYVTAAPAEIKEQARLLEPGLYSPMILDRFQSPAGVKFEDYQRDIWNSPRALELDRTFNAVHKISMAYVVNECELVTDAMNDMLPWIWRFDSKEHEDLYINRMWSVIATQIAAFTYGSSTDLSKADRTYMGTDYHFVEEVRGTEREVNAIVFMRHESRMVAGGWLPDDLIPHYRKFFVSHYHCTPEQLKRAREDFIFYFDEGPEALKITNAIREAHGLEPETVNEENRMSTLEKWLQL